MTRRLAMIVVVAAIVLAPSISIGTAQAHSFGGGVRSGGFHSGGFHGRSFDGDGFGHRGFFRGGFFGA